MADKTPFVASTPLQPTDTILYKELSANLYAQVYGASAMVGTNLVSDTNRLPVQTDATVTSDGEMWTTVTERENDVFSVYGAVFNATKYVVLIDRDNPLFPHRKQGQPGDRIDITSIYYSLDIATTTSATILYGVISRINAVNADVRYFAAIPFLTGANQEDRITSLRAVPSQVKLDINGGGVLGHGITNVGEVNVAALNTGTALDSPAGAGTVIPDVGDVIVKYLHVSGSANFATFLFYHGH